MYILLASEVAGLMELDPGLRVKPTHSQKEMWTKLIFFLNDALANSAHSNFIPLLDRHFKGQNLDKNVDYNNFRIHKPKSSVL